jgi:glyoxylase-like metal-dependent hydrolase (beta-lactamase superfamily II)
MDWELTAIRYAKSTLAHSNVFVGGDPEIKLPISFVMYDIEVGGRHILVDPGCDTMPGFVMEDYVLPLDALKQQGITPELVSDVIITHAHHDHIDCVRHFPDSVIHIQNAEALAGRKYLTGNTQVELFEDSVMVAGCVRVRKIGGHSIGSCVVELERGEEIWVIAGDECYSYDCLNQQIPTGSSCCPEKSKQFVEQYARKPYRVLLCHDPDTVTGPIV